MDVAFEGFYYIFLGAAEPTTEDDGQHFVAFIFGLICQQTSYDTLTDALESDGRAFDQHLQERLEAKYMARKGFPQIEVLSRFFAKLYQRSLVAGCKEAVGTNRSRGHQKGFTLIDAR
ncbi:MAG: hypothetical protein PWP23_2260 [Candidatus Sumerlaeota bacterium]|nr:hypothetical protein [Candidatus Sumerlaeota bacterium]